MRRSAAPSKTGTEGPLLKRVKFTPPATITKRVDTAVTGTAGAGGDGGVCNNKWNLAGPTSDQRILDVDSPAQISRASSNCLFHNVIKDVPLSAIHKPYNPFKEINELEIEAGGRGSRSILSFHLKNTKNPPSDLSNENQNVSFQNVVNT